MHEPYYLFLCIPSEKDDVAVLLMTVVSCLRSLLCVFCSILGFSFYLSQPVFFCESLWWTVSDLWSPEEIISLWDQRCSFSHSEFLVAKVLLKWKGIEKTSDIEGAEIVPLVLSRPYILFQLVTNNRKILPDPLPQHTS